MRRLLMALFFLPAIASGSSINIRGVTWYYDFADGKVSIGEADHQSIPQAIPWDTKGAIDIPSDVNGFPVTSIGDYAFSCCDGLTSVTIPESVTSIGRYAFYDSLGLRWVTIPSSVTSIGEWAFGSCYKLMLMTIPSSVTIIGDSAFEGCRGLSSIVVDTDNPAFSSDNGILYDKRKDVLICCPSGKTGSVTIPSSVTSIGARAFEWCSGLTSVTIPSSVTSIGDYAFEWCSGLTSVTIPEGVTSIGYAAFMNCSGLTSVTIPSSVTSIGDSAFRGCSGLIVVATDNPAFSSENGILYDKRKTLLICCPSGKTGAVAIPSSVTSIGDEAFFDCGRLTSVTISGGVTSIGEEAFWFCRELTSVTIPSSVTSIGEYAFRDCSKLRTVYVDVGDVDRVKDLFQTSGFNTSGVEFVAALKHRVVFCETPKSWIAEMPAVEEREMVGGASLGSLPTASMDGYTFDGWWVIDEDWKGGKWSDAYKSQVDADTIVTEDMVICGKWIANTYYISFNANGGSVSPNQIAVTFEDTIQDLPTPVWADHLFRGWYTADGKRFPSEVLEGDSEEGYYYSIASDLTVVASWEEVSSGGEVPPDDPEPPVDPVDPPFVPPMLYDETATVIDVTGGEVAPYDKAAAVYDGYAYDAKGAIVGTIQVKVAKAKVKKAKKSKVEGEGEDGGISATVTATVQMIGEKKKISFRGGVADKYGNVTGLTATGGRTLSISLGVDGMGGALDGKYTIDGARNVFSANDAESKATVKAIESMWVGAINVVGDDVALAVSVAKKGKVKVSGTVNGAKMTATSQLLVGETVCCVPVVITKKADFAFNLWLMDDGTVEIVGLEDAAVGKAGTLKSGATFAFDDDGVLGERTLPGLLEEYLPNGLEVMQNKTKWVVAPDEKGKAAKAGKVMFNKKTGEIDESKLGENPSALKLTYTAKTGSFKGSFKAYTLVDNKVKAYTFNITGVMIGDAAYGTATLKKPAISIPIVLE